MEYPAKLETPKDQAPSKKALEQHIDTDKPDKIRTFLTGDALPLISNFMSRAVKEKCDIYCALYELNDPSLLDLLKANADRVHLSSRPQATKSRPRVRTPRSYGTRQTKNRGRCYETR